MAKANLLLQEFKEPSGDKIYDPLLAHSGFQYFESKDFARTIFCKMLKKFSKKSPYWTCLTGYCKRSQSVIDLSLKQVMKLAKVSIKLTTYNMKTVV